ncbi:MAG: THUMP domain-containing protein, partial [Nanoarchaeota archaeon]
MYIAKTMSGMESIAAKEVKGKVILPQTVTFTKEKKDVRTINMIYKLIDHITFTSLNDITKGAEKLAKELEKKVKYEIRCYRKGEHPFKSVDVTTEIGTYLREKGITIDYKEPQKTMIIDIIDNNCLFGIVKETELCRRPYRVKFNNKSISSCIATAVIMIANPKKTDVILDPLCKDGVIPVEAHMLGIKKIHAIDPIKNNVRNAVINCKYAKTKITPQCYEVTWLDTLFKKNDIHHIITNILLSKHDKEPEKFVKEFFHQAEFIAKEAVTIITNKPDIIKNNAPSWNMENEI